MAKELSEAAKEFVRVSFPMVKCDNTACSKEFCRPTADWGYQMYYKGRRLKFCSYPCMRVMERRKEAEEAEAAKLKKIKKRGFIGGKYK